MMLTRILAIAVISSCAGGCSTVQTVDGSCKIFKPISNSQKDTEQTRREVIGHNRVYGAICKA